MYKEKALDALQTILNISANNLPGHEHGQIVDAAEHIAKALSDIQDEPVDEGRVSCFHIPGSSSVPISDARSCYHSGDLACQSCGACR